MKNQQSQTPQTPPQQPAGEGLAGALARIGYRVCRPAALAPAARTDLRTYRTMVCPACRHYGQRVTPMTRPGSYVVVLRCPRCHHEQEA